MSQNKKNIRKYFRDTCFKRDKYSCVMCSFKSSKEKASEELNCYHITNPKSMPDGGYIPLNGITLCLSCHIKSEKFHETGVFNPGYSVSELYVAISSSYQEAFEVSCKKYRILRNGLR